jgi:methylglutaconyl-CoA hydratase
MQTAARRGVAATATLSAATATAPSAPWAAAAAAARGLASAVAGAAGFRQEQMLREQQHQQQARGFASSPPADGDGSTSGDLHVTVEPQGAPYEGVSLLSLSRPRSKNAIGRQMLSELAEAINNLRQVGAQ